MSEAILRSKGRTDAFLLKGAAVDTPARDVLITTPTTLKWFFRLRVRKEKKESAVPRFCVLVLSIGAKIYIQMYRYSQHA